MHADHTVPITERIPELEKKYEEFRNAALVVTDRLHGMIFCAITGTPCIVINSKSPKIKGCFEWLKHLEYIKFCDNINDIPSIANTISGQTYAYDNALFTKYFETLISEIKSRI